MELTEAAGMVAKFQVGALRNQIASMEQDLEGIPGGKIGQMLANWGLSGRLLEASLHIKGLVGQINVIIHVVGTLLSLPHLLEPDEVIEYLSVGAGSTGKDFDLETDRRIGEFKFIEWKGGPEAIRQNSLFKDFFELAEADTKKRRCLYVLGLQHPMLFLRGRRALDSVLSKNNAVRDRSYGLYGERFRTVGDYYRFRNDRVELVDLAEIVPELRRS